MSRLILSWFTGHNILSDICLLCYLHCAHSFPCLFPCRLSCSLFWGGYQIYRDSHIPTLTSFALEYSQDVLIIGPIHGTFDNSPTDSQWPTAICSHDLRTPHSAQHLCLSHLKSAKKVRNFSLGLVWVHSKFQKIIAIDNNGATAAYRL